MIGRDLARRLIDSGGAGQAHGLASADATAAACDRVYRGLSRWIGRDGCHALFTRALAQARSSHPLLEQIKLDPRSGDYVDGMAPVIMQYGNAAATSALEAMLVVLIELLARLIGDDMATRLIGQTLSEVHPLDTRSPNTRKES